MAAPATVYVENGDYTLAAHKAGVFKYNALIALKLLEYGANIKTLFYLDALLMISDGFIGMVKIGGANAAYHNVLRHSKGILKDNTNVYIILNDAGLNTLGNITKPANVLKSTILDTTIKSFITKSAYYLDGSYGVEININNLGWIAIQFGTQNKNETLNIPDTNIANALEYGNTVRLRAYHLNSEGKWLSEEIDQFTVMAAAINLAYHASIASEAIGPGSTYYYTVLNLVGGKLFDDQEGATESALGYYVGAGKWYRVQGTTGNRIILQTGNATAGEWPGGDPANYETRSFNGLSATDQATACALPGNSAITLYRQLSENRYYKNLSGNLADDGWYIFGNGLARGWVRIVNGYQTSNGSCSGPD